MDVILTIEKLKQTTDGNEVKSLICDLVLLITSDATSISEKQTAIAAEYSEIKAGQAEIIEKQESLSEKHSEFSEKQEAADVENKSILESIRVELMKNQFGLAEKQESEMIEQLKSERESIIASMEEIKKENVELKKTLSTILQFMKKGVK